MSITFHSPQRGFAVVAAIFILVVLSMLGTYVMVVSTTQQIGSALDINGAKAYQAARSGTEWGLARAINNPGGACSAGGVTTGIGAINGMTVFVTCVTVATGVAVEPQFGSSYRITATACNQAACPAANPATPNYIERRIEVVADTQ